MRRAEDVLHLDSNLPKSAKAGVYFAKEDVEKSTSVFSMHESGELLPRCIAKVGKWL